VTDHIKFPLSYSSDTSEGAKRFNLFEELLLHNWPTVLANPTMWYVTFSHIPKPVRKLDRDNTLNKEGPNAYDQLQSNQKNLITSMTNSIGCMLAHSVELPTIQVQAGREQTRLGGYYSGLVSDTVTDENQIRMEFRETHSSISEFIFRPWIEAVAKNGLIARPPGDPRNVKCHIRIFQMGKVGPGTDPVTRKAWTFYNCVPTDISTQRYAHDGTWSAQDMFFNTTWVYSKYAIQDIRFDNMSELYKTHIESPLSRPDTSQRTSGRVGENDTPVAKITAI